MDTRFGDMCNELRIKQGITLREFCKQHGLDGHKIAMIEVGVMKPSEEVAKKHASLLGLEGGSEEYKEFMRLANEKMSDVEMMEAEALRRVLPAFPMHDADGNPIPIEKIKEMVTGMAKKLIDLSKGFGNETISAATAKRASGELLGQKKFPITTEDITKAWRDLQSRLSKNKIK